LYEKKLNPHNIHLILGTHWDREWLYSFEYSQSLLIEMMDNLLEYMDANPDFRFFHLDSQVVIVEDYLRAKPHNSDRLISLIKQGRILIGPYYSLLEENHILGESIIRNLLIGNKLANEYGRRMNVGYSPTGYGRISQLPQIFKSVGIDNIIFYRGLQQDKSNFEFLWEGPDKSQILGMRLTGPIGRGTFLVNLITPSFFPKGVNVDEIMIIQNDLNNPHSIERGFMDFVDEYKKEFNQKLLIEKFKEIEELLANDTSSDSLILIHAEDYGAAKDFIAETVETINNDAGYEKLKISSLPMFVEDFCQSLDTNKLALLHGEFKQSRKTFKDFPIYMSTISSINNIKVANRKAELALARYAEPWDTICAFIAKDTGKKLLENTWKDLLASHAHDSIAGQGTDEVIDNVYNRLLRVKQTSDGINEMSMKKLVSQIKMPKADNGTVFLTIYNSSATERNDVINLYIDMPFNLSDEHGDVFLSELWSKEEADPKYFVDLNNITLQIKDASGNEIAFAINKIEPLKPIGIKHSEWGKRRLCSNRFKCSLAVNNIPPLGYKVLAINHAQAEQKEKPKPKNISSIKNQLENDYLRIFINENGTLDVVDKRTGLQCNGLLLFEDSMEIGTMTQAKTSQSIVFDNVRADILLLENNHLCATYQIRTVLNISVSAAEDRMQRNNKTVGIEVCSKVTLKYNSSVIDVSTKVINLAKDHRFRVLFPTTLSTQKVFVDQPFDIVERDVKPKDFEDEYLEKPYTTLPMQSFIDVNDGTKGIAVMTLGLLEYEILHNPTNTIAITLLRCFQNINKFCGNVDYNSIRSQQIGEHEFKYAVYFHQGDVWQGKVHQKSEEHLLPLKAVQSYRKHINGLPPEFSFIKFNHEDISLSALKMSETDDAVILRFYNNTKKDINTSIKVWQKVKSANEVNSLEQTISVLNHKDDSININIKAKKIMSLGIKFE